MLHRDWGPNSHSCSHSLRPWTYSFRFYIRLWFRPPVKSTCLWIVEGSWETRKTSSHWHETSTNTPHRKVQTHNLPLAGVKYKINYLKIMTHLIYTDMLHKVIHVDDYNQKLHGLYLYFFCHHFIKILTWDKRCIKTPIRASHLNNMLFKYFTHVLGDEELGGQAG